MSSIWNNRISVSLFGEAQSHAVGVTVNNLPSGEFVDEVEIRRFMARLKDSDQSKNIMPHVMSGIYNGRTTGTPLCAFLQNTVSELFTVPENECLARAGHADYTGAVRYRGFNDVRDDGHFSDRLMIPLCFAGAVCGQILERRGIYTGTHIARVHNIKDNPFNPVRITREDIINLRNKDFPVINDRKGWLMAEDIERVCKSGDSLGGVVECAVINVPAGIGSPIFDGLQNTISQLIFGIPLVTGIEFGTGVKSCGMTGSQWNDDFYVDGHDHVLTRTNNHGGILGGISSGMPIIFKVTFRPDPTFAKPQTAVDLRKMTDMTYDTGKTASPLAIVKAVAVVEAVANIAVLNHMMDYPNFC